ncbi:N-acetylmuramoyl-L-alanine amidase [Patescibacteria group bacterium]|nr:N-acetylmuramoyl-L-alanine amidase [Patescibacteria group bacterium]MBU1682716.1 N-acetylmuramoyl-L-alanine amidase [Patescibacteria group bacterium]MBU1935238.1 N-acetylmuramoyl-L-alanine amidase [Patescibacteria group bacterium]
MLKKLFKHGLLMATAFLCLGFFTSNSFAADYNKHEIVVEKAGSEIIFENQPFSAVSVQLDEVIDDLMVNFGNGWEEVEIHDDGFGPEALLFTSPAYTVEFKRESGIPATLTSYVFYSEPEYVAAIGGPGLLASTQVAGISSNFEVISRVEWGADENLRYWNPDWDDDAGDDGEKTSSDPCGDFATTFAAELDISYVKEYSPSGELLTWPLQYMDRIRKIIVHHTDSEVRDLNGDHRMDSRDYKSMIRLIYQYHAVSRGWGDIGYNYIIDPLGNIYEGRYGGDKVIGAHALCYNNGSLGIAIIGNYEEDQVPEPALNALISLVAQKSRQYSIDPNGTSVFRGKQLSNIIGHRDVRATACPGRYLYELLPTVRERAALAIRSGTFRESNLQVENLDYNAEAISDFANITLRPNERKTLQLRFKNTGLETWDQNTWLHVALNNNPNARVIPAVEDKAFVAADLKESSVAPGKTGTFEITIEGGYYAGNYSFPVAPVVNGRYKVSRSAVNVAFAVDQPDLNYEVVDQVLPSGTVFQGEALQAAVQLKNTGNVIWKNYGDHQITLGTSGPRDRASIFIEENPSRLGYMIDSEVEPGETGRFVMNLQVPTDKSGLVIEQFTPVIENVGWLRDNALGFRVSIKEPTHLAKINKVNDINTLLPGEMVKVELEMENKGDLAWNMDNMQTILLGRGVAVFKRYLTPSDPVEPGDTANFDFWVQAPYEEGNHSIFLRSKYNDTSIRGGVARYAISVSKPSLRAELIEQENANINLKPGQEKELTVSFKNTGNVIWRNKGPNAVYLGASNPRDRLSRLYYEDGWTNKYRSATLEETVIYPGETGTFKFKIKPEDKGVYSEGFQLVVENVGWIVGGNARYTFRVFGDRVTSSTDLTDAEINHVRASSVITQATTTAPVEEESVEEEDTEETAAKPPLSGTPSEDTEETPFRVRLSYGGSSSKITSNNNFKITDGNGTQLFSVAAGNTASVRKVGNNIHVQVGSSSKSGSVIRFVPIGNGIMEIVTMENRPAWNTSLNDNRFRGTIEVRVVNGEAAYINELPLEDYLKGLGEVSNSDHFEKQKTIAVLARTYARFYMEEENRKFPGLPYDGSDDPDIFQKYLGYGLEARSPNFAGAVAITSDEVVTYQGELVKTPYFNQSDGSTRSAEEVWGWTNTPYLKSVADPWCAGLTKNGHGVGLSGFGASAQAEEGKTYDEIIKYYYQGVEVEELNFE